MEFSTISKSYHQEVVQKVFAVKANVKLHFFVLNSCMVLIIYFKMFHRFNFLYNKYVIHVCLKLAVRLLKKLIIQKNNIPYVSIWFSKPSHSIFIQSKDDKTPNVYSENSDRRKSILLGVHKQQRYMYIFSCPLWRNFVEF